MENFQTQSLVVFLTLLLCFYGCTLGVNAQNPPFSAIYQFGDSISDTGNMLREGGGCSTPPYGETYFGHPTGRCSDGLLIVDHFAMAFKIPLLNPYLDRSANFSQGVNFAVAGATALDVSFLARKRITAVATRSSLLVQLGWFKTHLATICSDPSTCRWKLRNALFVVGGIGGDDYNSGGLAGENLQDLRSLVPDVIQAISEAVKQLIDLGATRIIVPGSFPVGCMPICGASLYSNPAYYDELGCLRSWNDFAAFHNDQLQGAIKSIEQQNRGVKIVYGDYFTALKVLLQNADRLGFDRNVMYEACCSNCGSPGGTSCPNPNARVSWDGLHMTSHAYHFVAHRLMKQIRLL